MVRIRRFLAMAGIFASLGSAASQYPQVTLIPGLMSSLTTASNNSSVTFDAAGNLYYSDDSANVVHKVTPSGSNTILAGGGSDASASYSGSPTGVQLNLPAGLAFDSSGNLFIADYGNHVVRMVDASAGNISTVAGNGTAGSSGDGGPATSASLNGPCGLTTDSRGNVYVSDITSNVVRSFAPDSNIVAVAGTGVKGYAGDWGRAQAANLNAPAGLAMYEDEASYRYLYIADRGNSVIRKVDLDLGNGILTTAGSGTAGFSGDGGFSTSAELNHPSGIAVSPTGTLYIADTGNSRIRAEDSNTGVITTLAGNGSIKYVQGAPSTQNGMELPVGVAVDSSGNVYVAAPASPIYKVTVGTSELIFASTPMGQSSAPQTFTLWNSGNATLYITPPFGMGGDARDFAAQTTCGVEILAGQTCTTSVVFTPSANTFRSAGLSIIDNAPGTPQIVSLDASAGPEQIGLFIDSPGTQSSPFLGVATFSGWAIDNAGTINTLAVLVDGVLVGTASYGSSRPDVCAAYPDQIGCPNVGWVFRFDTTTVANGTHTLEIRATSSSGRHAATQSTFTVANWTGNTADPIHGFIDMPGSSSGAFSGAASFSGWAIDDVSAIASVAVAVDGIAMGNANYGGNRPDVCAAYAGRQGCPNVGWNFTLNTSLLTDGPHTLAVTPMSSSGASSTFTRSFTVANLTSQNPIHLSIDTPGQNSGAFNGSAHFGGWALDTTSNITITRVAVSVDGIFTGNTGYGGTRNDVCAAYPAAAGCPGVGWNYMLDTTKLADGNHMLEVTAYASDGSAATQGSSFTTANSTATNPTRIFIDVPNGSSSILQGVTTVSGWASNDNSVIPANGISVYVDGNYEGTANYGNIARPDVCTVYPGSASCPNVGWNLLLDTTTLADGTHTLTVSASASNGQSNIVRSTFTVANWSATANPFRMSIDTPSETNAPLSGSSPIGGWALNNNEAIASVTVSVDGVPAGTASYGGTRTDVCAAFPNRPGCPNVGWNGLLDTTLLSDGSHTLDVMATSASGESYMITRSFTVSNIGGKSGIGMIIDAPSGSSGAFSGSAAFGGWTISDNAAIATVAIYVDGTFAGDATYGVARPNVCAVYPGRANCPNVGWNVVLDTTQFANGAHTLEVTATDVKGNRATESASFKVNN